jgi:hypothetical protein
MGVTGIDGLGNLSATHHLVLEVDEIIDVSKAAMEPVSMHSYADASHSLGESIDARTVD